MDERNGCATDDASMAAARATTPAVREQPMDELSEPAASALKLLHEKQTAEINAKDLLLARKNERIEELLQQLTVKDQQLAAKDWAVEHGKAKIQECEGEIQELKLQLEKEEDEFQLIHAVMETKDHQIMKKNEEITQQKEVEVQLKKEMDKLQVQLRKCEKLVENNQPPETMDACLSPRSFHENQLISLRDDAIHAKTKEIWLLAGQNDQLRCQLDELEAELERLQTSFMSKENDLAKRDRKIEKLEAEIESLQVARQQAEGRERAIEIATTQNTKLLQALQTQEVQRDDLQLHLEQVEREYQELKLHYREILKTSAVNEVEVLHKSKEAEHKSSALSILQDKLHKERKSLHDELARERIQAQLEVEKLQSELVMRRNKQYELTLRVQESDAKLHELTDELEAVREQLIATRGRMDEAERVLHDSLLWKKALEEELASCRNEKKQSSVEMEKQVNARQIEVVALRGQLKELKESLIQSLDLEKKNTFRINELKRLVENKEQLLGEQKDRIARLVHEIAKGGQAREEGELERKIVKDQLEKVKTQMNDAIRDAMEQCGRMEDKWKTAVAKHKELEKEHLREQRGKSRIVAMFLQAYSTAAKASNATASFLDLRECWLADHDTTSIFRMLETNAALRTTLTRMDLRGNRLTCESIQAIVQYFRKCVQPQPPSTTAGAIRELDLRLNFISLDGIRILANALEAMVSPDGSRDPRESREAPFGKVMVVNGGRIECFPDAHVSNNEIPMLSVDITDNGNPGTLFHIGSTIQKRRQRRDESDPAARTSSIDPVLQEIYGLDLVQAFMSEPPTTITRARRKSNDTSSSSPSPLPLPSSSRLLEVSASNNTPTPTTYGLPSPSPRLGFSMPRARDSSPRQSQPSPLSTSASLPRL